ncbi:hypothetical protein ABZP36_015561 [Zizania latifolia]
MAFSPLKHVSNRLCIPTASSRVCSERCCWLARCGGREARSLAVAKGRCGSQRQACAQPAATRGAQTRGNRRREARRLADPDLVSERPRRPSRRRRRPSRRAPRRSPCASPLDDDYSCRTPTPRLKEPATCPPVPRKPKPAPRKPKPAACRKLLFDPAQAVSFRLPELERLFRPMPPPPPRLKTESPGLQPRVRAYCLVPASLLGYRDSATRTRWLGAHPHVTSPNTGTKCCVSASVRAHRLRPRAYAPIPSARGSRGDRARDANAATSPPPPCPPACLRRSYRARSARGLPLDATPPGLVAAADAGAAA